MLDLLKYTLHLADNKLILGQRLGEWCGHGPVLEQDIALTNIALDLIGQARLLYQYAATNDGEGRNEDQLAMIRPESEYLNCQLVEYPNTDFAYTIARQYFFDQYHILLNEQLINSPDEQLSAIAQKSIKEIRYHLKYSSEWVLRLGDGTEESHNRIQDAVNSLWPYTGGLFEPVDYEVSMQRKGVGPDIQQLRSVWESAVRDHMSRATLELPEGEWMHSSGKNGYHTEHMGYILTELQYMQRTYPSMQW